jgi:hypothetical protein
LIISVGLTLLTVLNLLTLQRRSKSHISNGDRDPKGPRHTFEKVSSEPSKMKVFSLTRNFFLRHESQLRALNERPLPEAFRGTRVRVVWGARSGFYSANAQGRLTLRISGSNHKGEAPQKVGRKCRRRARATRQWTRARSARARALGGKKQTKSKSAFERVWGERAS